MTELSYIAKIKQALELAKKAKTGCLLTLFDVIELKGYIESLEETIALYDHEPSNSDGSMTKDITDDLKPCPHCESENIHFERWLNEEDKSFKTFYRAICHVCFYTPDYWDEDIKKAILYWNDRPLEDALLKRAQKAEAELEKWKGFAKDLADELTEANSQLFSVSWEDANEASSAWIAYCNFRDKEK